MEGFLSFITAGVGLTFMVMMYLVQAFAWYKLSEKAGLSYRWIAFVPVLQFILFFGIIKKNPLWILIAIVPFVNVVAYIYFYYLFYRAFDTPDLLIVLCLVFPPLGGLYMLYMAYFDDVRYVGNR
ncbi:DUF5684 domain-containing protein [Peptoclostridium litorale]|uniref:DUF5684 domain-containing protein n=1 Tax=Peptoclostridium litorale TaxID=1557 RepID=UPI001A9A47DE|nr:DUF5684 domain-containing protein [Peptoclostridium litorale]